MIVYGCDICGFYHSWYWDGDCREESIRLTEADLPEDVLVLTMEDRLDADQYDKEDEEHESQVSTTPL